MDPDIRARNIGEMVHYKGPAFDQLRQQGPEYARAAKRRALGKRVCEGEGCSVVLSSYNESVMCWVHDV